MTNPFKAWNRDFKLLAAAVFAVGAFFGVQLGLYNNFVVSRLAIEPHELGLSLIHISEPTRPY